MSPTPPQGFGVGGAPHDGDGDTCLQVDHREGPVRPLDDGGQVLRGGREESPKSAKKPSLLRLPVALQVGAADAAHVPGEGHVQGHQAELGTQRVGGGEMGTQWGWGLQGARPAVPLPLAARGNGTAAPRSPVPVPGGCRPMVTGGPQAPLSPPLPMAEQPPRGAVLTEGILGATVVGRILGGPAPSSFGTCDNRTRGSLGAPTPVPGVQPPPHPSRCPPQGLPVLSPSPPSLAALTSESVWAPAGGSVLGPRVCTLFASWIKKEGTVPGGLCPPPPMACQEGLQPWSSPGTAAWRQRGRHRQRATPSPPAAP